MHAMVLKAIGHKLEWTELPDRLPGPGEIRVKVAACGVCRTDLHVVDGELAEQLLPIIPVTRSSAASRPLALASAPSASVSASASRGSAIPAASVPTARRRLKISAIGRSSPATRGMADTPQL
jgi:hypothetical protein